MPAYLVFSATEPGPSISFDAAGPAIAWCKQQAGLGRYRVVEVPNEGGKLLVVNPLTSKVVFVT